MVSEKITYKEALEELEEIVNGIESEEVDVDELAKKVERASKLLTVCSEKLRKTETEVDKIIEKLNDSE
ncbi:MAG: exodeoxyribonuclease VII small subunit [Flavobacteriales bacterium]|nr:exodeoxyribonuclease VII small subunit [Flavobacteriales bacterium]MBO72447.1 exodeoxyribonuclease VII small subunit [Flavobacteriales bacterium]